MTESIFIDISLVLGIAIGIAFVEQLFRQPLIISYIITGIICGPVFLNLINSSQHFFDIFAKFGVILLLFLVGISLNIDYLRKIGKVAAITGIGQAVFTSLVGFLLLMALISASALALVTIAKAAPGSLATSVCSSTGPDITIPATSSIVSSLSSSVTSAAGAEESPF